jgi:hypothetical protein
VLRIVWSVVLAFSTVGCSNGPVSRPHTPSGSGSAVPADAPVATGPTAPTEQECEQLFRHVVALHMAEQRRTVPTDQLPTEAEQAQLREELAADGECRKLRRSELTCALAATTLAEVEACQPIRSSSTSNSRVAPPGITPPAPRSP